MCKFSLALALERFLVSIISPIKFILQYLISIGRSHDYDDGDYNKPSLLIEWTRFLATH